MSSTETLTAEQLAQRLEDLAARLRENPPPGVIRTPEIRLEWFSYRWPNDGPSRNEVLRWARTFYGLTRDLSQYGWIDTSNGHGNTLTVFIRNENEEAAK